MVTGGTRGIGAAICHSLAAQGAAVAAGYGRDRERAEAFQAELSKDEIPVSIHQGNIGSAEDCRRTVQEVIDHHGRLDILVNNAGITSDKTIFKMTDEDWYKVLAVNLSGAFFMSRAALEHMIERGTGRIINISSIIGQTGNIGQTNYAASKSGLFGLTTSLAKEAAFALKKADKLDGNEVGLTVNTVAPGFIETEMLDDRAREGPGPHPRPGAAGAPGAPARGRARRALPGCRRRRLHHRPGLGRQRRPGHVAPMGDDDIRALAAGAFARFNEREDHNAFFDAYDPDVVLHGYPAGLQGRDGLRAFHEALWEAFPDAHLTVEDLVVEADRAALRYRLQGTHSGELPRRRPDRSWLRRGGPDAAATGGRARGGGVAQPDRAGDPAPARSRPGQRAARGSRTCGASAPLGVGRGGRSATGRARGGPR